MLARKHLLSTSAVQNDGADSSRSIVVAFDSERNSETSTHQRHDKEAAAVFSVCRCCSSTCGRDAQAQRQQWPPALCWTSRAAIEGMQSTHTSWCPVYRRRWSAGTSPGSRAVHSSPCP